MRNILYTGLEFTVIKNVIVIGSNGPLYKFNVHKFSL